MSVLRRFGPTPAAPHRLVVLALATIAIGACSSDTAPTASHEIDGPAVTVGQGTAHSYIISGPNGVSSVGIALSASALNNLPTTDAMWTLALPAGTAAPPFDHFELNWNAMGHPPSVYMLPHFDFHFYTITPTAQAAIQGGPDTIAVPAADVPPNYVSGVQSVPDMGVHWVDTTSAEFQGHVFDHTFIYGFSQGHMVFVEPMVTRAFLASTPNVTLPVKQPQAFAAPGRYPTEYSITTDADGTVRVALDSLVAR